MKKLVLESIKVGQVHFNNDATSLNKTSINNMNVSKDNLSLNHKIEVNKKLKLLKTLSEKKETKFDNEVKEGDEDKENDGIKNNEGLFFSQQIMLLIPFYLKNKLSINNKLIKKEINIDNINKKTRVERSAIDNTIRKTDDYSMQLNKRLGIVKNFNKIDKSINSFYKSMLNIQTKENNGISKSNEVLKINRLNKINKDENIDEFQIIGRGNDSSSVNFDNLPRDFNSFNGKSNGNGKKKIINDSNKNSDIENNKLSLDLSTNKIIELKDKSLVENKEEGLKNISSIKEIRKNNIETKEIIDNGSLFQLNFKSVNKNIIPLSAKSVLEIPQWSILKNIDDKQNMAPSLVYAFKSWGSEKHQIQIRFMLDNQLQLIASTGRVYQASFDSFNQYQGRYSLSLENREKNTNWHINAIDNDDPRNDEDN